MMEQGVRCLRELAVLEIVFSEDKGFPKSPDGVQYASQMWLKFAQLGLVVYSCYLATLQWRKGEDKVGALVSKLGIYEDTVAAPLRAHVSPVETKLAGHVWSLEEKIEEGYQKLREELKEAIFRISPGQTRVSSIRSRRPPAKERVYTPRGYTPGSIGVMMSCPVLLKGPPGRIYRKGTISTVTRTRGALPLAR